jgi:hypothetical protein
MFGLDSRNLWVDVDDQDVWVHAGWVVQGRLPLRAIRLVERRPALSPGQPPSSIVEIFSDPPAPVRYLGFDRRLGWLRLNVVDPDGLVREIERRTDAR